MARYVDGWNHNSHYHDFLLSAVPGGCLRALDVGCGHGTFARRLASCSRQVVALDQDASIIGQARELSTAALNIRYVEADFRSWHGEEGFDFVSMIAVLHHLPFAEALRKAASLLRKGGVLAVLGLHRPPSRALSIAESAVALPVSMYFLHVRRASPVLASIANPQMTLQEIRRGAKTLLPQSRVRRHLLWRYSLVWKKPAA